MLSLPDMPTEKALIGGEWVATRSTLTVEAPSYLSLIHI